jgi:hypothetical protein
MTMRTGTAFYWMPVTFNSIRYKGSTYQGVSGKKLDALEEWFGEGLDNFNYIYGTVVDAYYYVDDVSLNEKSRWDFIINIVVTGIVDSETHFYDVTNDEWPKDIIEQLKTANEDVSSGNIMGWDYNPVLNGPIAERYNE